MSNYGHSRCKPQGPVPRPILITIYELNIFHAHSDLGHLENWTKIFHSHTSSGASDRASERTNERSGAREQSEQCGASERVSGASEQASGRASVPVLTISNSFESLCCGSKPFPMQRLDFKSFSIAIFMGNKKRGTNVKCLRRQINLRNQDSSSKNRQQNTF